MLECGKNFKGTLGDKCNNCHELDNESHRLNSCIKYRDINNYDQETKVCFELIYSHDPRVLKEIIPEIMKLWNLSNANGTMKN